MIILKTLRIDGSDWWIKRLNILVEVEVLIRGSWIDISVVSIIVRLQFVDEKRSVALESRPVDFFSMVILAISTSSGTINAGSEMIFYRPNWRFRRLVRWNVGHCARMGSLGLGKIQVTGIGVYTVWPRKKVWTGDGSFWGNSPYSSASSRACPWVNIGAICVEGVQL